MVDVIDREPVRVLLLGMRCSFTETVAEALIADSGVEIVGAVVPGQRSIGTVSPSGRPSIALTSDTSVARLDVLLRQNGIPLVATPSLRMRDLEPRLAHLDLSRLAAIIVACFPWKVPRRLRALPRFGALNVHPSLLPALRGPEPEFWALRLGLRETGVTVHLMDDGLDTGPILAQRPVPISRDTTMPALERSLARVGGSLACEALRLLRSGEAEPHEQTGTASYSPIPRPYDLAVPSDLPAGWAARFVHAVAPVYAPLTVLVMATGQRLQVDGVVGVDEQGELAEPLEEDGETVAVRFSPGVVRFHRA